MVGCSYVMFLSETGRLASQKKKCIMTADRQRAGMFLAAGWMVLFSGCSQETPPFEAKYLSRNTVHVTYQNRQHVLNRYSASAPVPFQYRFEEDGDLDLLIDGKTYEVDSPYDRDRAKNKKKKAATRAAAVSKKPSKAASRKQ